LIKSPILQSYSFEQRAADARILQAGIRPNPELAITTENFLGTGAVSGVKGLETTLQLSQILDIGGTRAKQVEAAQNERALVDADYQLEHIEVMAEVARRFTEAVADAERLGVARRAVKVAQETVSAVRLRVEAGAVSSVELYKARNALAVLRLEEQHADHKLAVCRQMLAAAMGETSADFGTVAGDLMRLPRVPDFESLATRLEQSPVIARFASEARWREAQVRLAESLRRTGLQVSGGLRRLEATNDFGLVAGVSIPLGFRNQQAGAIREARERRAQVEVSAKAAQLELRATLYQVYQEMLQSRSTLDQLQKEIIPTAEETLSLTEQGYRCGRYSLLELLDIQKSLIELRGQLVANAAAYQLHVIEIERLIGGPIDGPTNQS
jgi:cobalt-zinc-cadmium efflux system outer membrane protein